MIYNFIQSIEVIKSENSNLKTYLNIPNSEDMSMPKAGFTVLMKRFETSSEYAI